jgi:DNA-binding transcriptional ArsR family regulator
LPAGIIRPIIQDNRLGLEDRLLAGLFGSATAEKVLLFLANYGEGYTREIATTFEVSPQMVHEQLLRFERAGVLVSRRRGSVRLFTFNPRYPFRKELLTLLEAALDALPEADRQQYFRERRRPRA